VPSDSDPFVAALADLGRAVRGLDEVVDLAGPGLAASIARIHDALEVRHQADRVLAAAVDVVRADGGTWQQIGDALGTTRQDKTTLDGADARAIEIFAALAAGDWTAVHGWFDPTMAGALPPERLADTWATVVGTVGAYERPGEPFVRRQGDFTVVDLPLAFEAGDMTGRIAFRADGRVAGLFVLAPEQADR
jgi:Protein of unknown function (DUF3887)